MASKQTMDRKREACLNYYLYGDATGRELEQKEIAKKEGISPVTMSNWVKKYGWKKLKDSLILTPHEELSRMYAQLAELNRHISNRPEGERYPQGKEPDTQIKLTSSIKKLETEASIKEVVSVSKRLLNWLKQFNPDKAAEVGAIFNDFIKDVLKS